MSGDRLRDEPLVDIIERRYKTTSGVRDVPVGRVWTDIHALIAIARRAEATEQAMQAHIDAAREQMAEQIAQAVKALPHGKTHDTPWLPDIDAGWRHCRMDVLDVIRQHAKGVGTP